MKLNKRVDLRDQIESHCTSCSHNETSMCSGCFFGEVDFGTPTLGGHEQYSRAFGYLKLTSVKGFKRNRPFGNSLNIPERKVIHA